jgi:hypothetical protein
MKPVRKIKDYLWIDYIHNKLVKGFPDGTEIARTQYSQFLRSYPYPQTLLNDIYDARFYARPNWFSEEFCLRDPDGKNYYYFRDEPRDKDFRLLYGYSKNKHSRSHPEFPNKLLANELNKPTHLQNNNVVMWCLYEAVTMNQKILADIPDKLFDGLSQYLCDPDMVTSNIEQKCVLLENKAYLNNTLKYYPDYLTRHLNEYYSYLSTSLKDFSVLSAHIDNLCKPEVGKNVFIEHIHFDMVPLKIQLKIASIVINQPEYDISRYPAVQSFLKDEKMLIEYVKTYDKTMSIASLTKLVNNKDTLIKLITEGHYQIINLDNLDTVITSQHTEKLLINQKFLNRETIYKLLIQYEKQHPHLTRVELDSFIEQNQPIYFKMYTHQTISDSIKRKVPTPLQ